MNSLPATLRPWSRALVFPLLGKGGAGGGTEAGGGGRNCRLLPVLIKWPYGEWTTPTWLSVLPTMLRHQKALLGDHAIFQADMWFTTSASFRKTHAINPPLKALKYLLYGAKRTLGIFLFVCPTTLRNFSEYTFLLFWRCCLGNLLFFNFLFPIWAKKLSRFLHFSRKDQCSTLLSCLALCSERPKSNFFFCQNTRLKSFVSNVKTLFRR